MKVGTINKGKEYKTMIYKITAIDKYTNERKQLEYDCGYPNINIDYIKAKYKCTEYDPNSIEAKQVQLNKKEQYILKNIYYEINHGYTYGEQIDNVPYPYFHDVLYKTFPCNNIGWNIYGSSAHENKISELRWIILIIFQCLPSEFIKKYQLRKIKK